LALQNQYEGESEKLGQLWVSFEVLLLSLEKLIQQIIEELFIECRILVRRRVSGLDYLADDSLDLSHDVLGLGLHFHDLLAELEMHLQDQMAVKGLINGCLHGAILLGEVIIDELVRHEIR
jgi:hypothetical protein